MTVGQGDADLVQLVSEVRACRLCADHLEPRPVIQVHGDARLLVVGQAPGRRVHDTGVPFNDPSGERLRDWLGIDRDMFYDPRQVALLPMGFCFPGTGRGGDLPPRPECAARWRAPLLAALPNIAITVLVGRHAIDWHLPARQSGSARRLTDVVADWRCHAPSMFVCPHPSPRNNRWLRERPWFEAEVVPEMRRRVRELLR